MRTYEENINGDNPVVPIVIPVADIDDEITKACVANLKQVTSLPAKIVLVEATGGEFSFGRSINQGFKSTEGFDIVICMDSDAFPEALAVERIFDYINSNESLGYVGAKVKVNGSFTRIAFTDLNLPQFIYNTVIRDKAPFYTIRRLLRGNWFSFAKDVEDFENYGLYGVTSTFIAIRRKCWEDVGGFDEEYRIQLSDVDFCYRVLLSKWFISTCTDSVVFHDIHKTQKARGTFHGFPGLDHFSKVWTKEKMKAVRKAAKEGKFIIPED